VSEINRDMLDDGLLSLISKHCRLEKAGENV